MKKPQCLASLRGVLALQVALPVLILLAVILMIGLSIISGFIEQRMQRDLQQVARTIYLPVSQALERHDLEQLQSSMASVFNISEVYGVYLFDKEGQRLSSFGAVNPSREQATEALDNIIKKGEFERYESIRGRRVYSFFMPLFNEVGQPNGLLQVTRRRSDIDNELLLLRSWTWGGFAVLAAVIFGMLMITHQRAIGRPLRRLLSSIDEVSEGNRQHRTVPEGPSEVKQLSLGLNRMLDAIETAENSETVQRQAREKMADRLSQAQTLAALGQISAGVAHELGAPLTVVDGRARRLLRHHVSEQQKIELQDIRQQVSRMTAIIEQLLSFGRSSRNKQRDLSVTDWVARSVSLLNDDASRINVTGGQEIRIKGDAFSLEQALVNLLRNACHACPYGQIQLCWQIQGQRLQLQVDDAGSGVKQEIREQIFDPFFTSKPPGEGSGMGLAIVQRVMKEHNGQARVEDSVLGGACFILDLPLTNEQDINHDT